jgi:hypothetical protein
VWRQVAGAELVESEITLYQAVLVALNEAIVKADWSPPKVNISFTITHIRNKLTYLCGN